jgi:phage-related protein
MFAFNGESSDMHGVVVQYYPGVAHGKRTVTTEHIPGRNGDRAVYDGSFANCTQTYEVYLRGGRDGISQTADDVAQWLLSPTDYCRLEDSYSPDVFRLAQFSGPLEIENILNRFGTATLEFDCKPQRFYKSGETAITMEEPGMLYNSGMEAQPLITVYGTGPGTLTIGNTAVTIKSMDQYVILDCEKGNAYKPGENKNSTIYAVPFPTLAPGENNITWSGGVTKIEMIPRWWTI